MSIYQMWAEEQRRASVCYVDHILRGAKPSDLLVELPLKFNLSINLKHRGSLGTDGAVLALDNEAIE